MLVFFAGLSHIRGNLSSRTGSCVDARGGPEIARKRGWRLCDDAAAGANAHVRQDGRGRERVGRPYRDLKPFGVSGIGWKTDRGNPNLRWRNATQKGSLGKEFTSATAGERERVGPSDGVSGRSGTAKCLSATGSHGRLPDGDIIPRHPYHNV